MVLFDRSWYNRAGVVRVMEFCNPEEYLEFMRHEGLDTIVLRMSNREDIPAGPKLIPTGALARYEIDGRWADIKNCKARLKSITRPRELAALTV